MLFKTLNAFVRPDAILLEAIDQCDSLVRWAPETFFPWDRGTFDRSWQLKLFPRAAAKAQRIFTNLEDAEEVLRLCGSSLKFLDVCHSSQAPIVNWRTYNKFTALRTFSIHYQPTALLFKPENLDGFEAMPAGLVVYLDNPSFDLDPADFEAIRVAVIASPVRKIVVLGRFNTAGPGMEEVDFWKSIDKVDVNVELSHGVPLALSVHGPVYGETPGHGEELPDSDVDGSDLDGSSLGSDGSQSDESEDESETGDDSSESNEEASDVDDKPSPNGTA